MLKHCPNCKYGIHFPDTIFDEPFACESCGSILKPEINEPGTEHAEVFDLKIIEINNCHINPVEWTVGGYPVFTDPGQFKKWEKQNRKKVLEEINEVLDARAVELAAFAVESRETFIVEEIKRLAAQIESIETERLDALGVFEKKYDDHLEKINSEMRTFKLGLRRLKAKKS
jgi:hypothetical protein